MVTWNDSEEDFVEEENEKEVTNICFTVIDELDEISSNLNYDDLQNSFEKLYKDLENIGLKNVSLKKKIQSPEKELKELKEKFSKFENVKTSLKKRIKFWKRKISDYPPHFQFSLVVKKSFDIILANQKCIFDKKGLWYKSSKNEKYFKNDFVKESSSANPSTTCNSFRKWGYISSTCSLINGS